MAHRRECGCGAPDWYPVAYGDYRDRLTEVWNHIWAQDRKIAQLGVENVTTQQDIDTLTSALNDEDSKLNTAVAGIQAEIAALIAQQPTLDLTGLQAAVAATADAVTQAAALVPPPAPTG